MKKMTTKHGHEWLLPETVGEFQNAGINLDMLCHWAGVHLSMLMSQRSLANHKHGYKFNPFIGKMKQHLSAEQKAAEKAEKMMSKMSPEVRAALVAALNGK